MRLVFEPDTLCSSDGDVHDTLLSLLMACEDGRHVWHVESPAEVKASRFYGDLSTRYKRRVNVLLEQSDNLATSSSRDRCLVHIGCYPSPSFSAQVWRVPWHLGKTLARRPVHIIVENADSDGKFVELILLRYGERRLKGFLGESEFRRIKEGWQPGRGDDYFFKIEHAGGHVGRAILRHHGDPAPLPPCVMALVDSDKSWPDDNEGPTAHSTRAKVDEISRESAYFGRYRPALHVTHRRELENYIPPEALERWARQENEVSRYQAFATLTPQQQAFYDLKKGLASCLNVPTDRIDRGSVPESWPWRHPALRDFFCLSHSEGGDDIPSAVTTLPKLLNGFGSQVWKALDHVGVTGNARQQLGQTAGAEFDEIIQLILKCL